jgi:hypothetical protein
MMVILYLLVITNIANIAFAFEDTALDVSPTKNKHLTLAQIAGGHLGYDLRSRGTQLPCGLKCFLEKVKIIVPDVEKKVLFSTLYLTDIVCGNMALNDISSAYKVPVTLSVKNIGFDLTCSLNYSWALFEGNATATASKSSMAGDIEFIKDSKTNLTSSSKFSNGNVIINVENIDFSGTFLNSSMYT